MLSFCLRVLNMLLDLIINYSIFGKYHYYFEEDLIYLLQQELSLITEETFQILYIKGDRLATFIVCTSER